MFRGGAGCSGDSRSAVVTIFQLLPKLGAALYYRTHLDLIAT
jgi:hypothetical protein